MKKKEEIEGELADTLETLYSPEQKMNARQALVRFSARLIDWQI